MLSSQFGLVKKAEGVARYLRLKRTGWPRLINLEVTKLCNAQCDFCPCWTIKGYPQLDDFSPILKKFRPIILSINGGEPLLRRDLPEIIASCRPYTTYLTLITHGQLLTPEKVKQFWELGVDQLTISRNYIDERHDEERKLPGLTQHFRELLPAMTAQGYDFLTFNTVLMAENLEHAVPLAKQAHEWGMKISFSSYTPYKNRNDEHCVPADQLRRLESVIEELLELRRTQGNILSSTHYLQQIPRYFRDGHMPDCRAGLNFVQVTPDGFVKRCSEKVPMLHWTDYDPAKIPPNKCDVCWLSCRGETETPLTPSRLWEFIKQ